MAARMMMMEMTIISSSSVNPRAIHERRSEPRFKCASTLPITVLLSVQCLFFRLGTHVEDVLAAPRSRVGGVVRRSQLPIGFPRDRVDGQPSQVDLLFGR